ncbi:hypothetical protein AB205_0031450 [Aquarana catesbeiana]|uniref:Uncharacterized protein n=1 Tax=Aquarana catesbeiana TaxID=8400 RepID=A0A2G9Q637_AQUCT|nr:hypothetical protein AB205_0031450 [Aquarana catesbeiana]
MLEMVDILKKADYDGKYGPYPNPNIRKAKIMAKVVKSLHRNFGVQRLKDQLRKRWSDLKLREPEQYRKIRRVLQKRGPHRCSSVYYRGVSICEACTKQGRKDSEDTPHPRRPQTPHLGKKGKYPPTEAEQEEEEDVVEIDTTTGDRDVVDPDPFTSESSQILIGEIMGCNLELENLKKKINDVIQKNNNIIHVLGLI